MSIQPVHTSQIPQESVGKELKEKDIASFFAYLKNLVNKMEKEAEEFCDKVKTTIEEGGKKVDKFLDKAEKAVENAAKKAEKKAEGVLNKFEHWLHGDGRGRGRA